MSIIYPTSKKCYCGSISIKKNGAYELQIQQRVMKKRIYYCSITFYDESEAIDLMKEKSIEYNIPIKNLVYDMGDYYEMDVGGLRMKFDKDDLELLQNHLIHKAIKNNGKNIYSSTTIDKKQVYIHNLIMNFKPTRKNTIDHVNRDSMDNRKSNLRVATKKEQIHNRNINKNCKSGIRYLYKTTKKRDNIDYWIIDINHLKIRKYFSCKKYGDETAKQNAINFLSTIDIDGEKEKSKC